MSPDRDGTNLKVGDYVCVLFCVKEAGEGENAPNLRLESVEPLSADGTKSNIVLNSRQCCVVERDVDGTFHHHVDLTPRYNRGGEKMIGDKVVNKPEKFVAPLPTPAEKKAQADLEKEYGKLDKIEGDSEAKLKADELKAKLDAAKDKKDK